MMVFINNGQIICFGLQRPSSGLTTFLLKEFHIICLNRVVIHRPNIHPTKFTLAIARKMMMRFEHHHAV